MQGLKVKACPKFPLQKNDTPLRRLCMVEVHEIRKSFGDITALEGISFRVREGEIYGFLGPNGAGKTTAISIMSGLMLADSGTVRIAGMDIRRDGRKIRRLPPPHPATHRPTPGPPARSG